MKQDWRFAGARRVPAAALLLALAALPAAVFAQTLEQRTQAATATATGNAACTSLKKFYWEIGDQNAKLASGTWGPAPPGAGTQMPVYSASKWVYGAYVFQRRGGVLNASDLASLRMRAGYTESSQCLFNTTVGACFGAMDVQDPAAVGKFFYAAGNFQKHASVDMGLSSMNKTQLATEIHTELGNDWVFTYNQPQLAGRGRSSATDYGKFLRKMLGGTLLLSGSALGSDAVCTYTGPTDPQTGRVHCADALYTPTDDQAAGMHEAWDYSIGHWVENDPVNGDGAFSSPGAAGFYPWIDASRNWYGILAREQIGGTSSAQSVFCGRLIRKAWVTGIAQ